MSQINDRLISLIPIPEYNYENESGIVPEFAI